VISAELFQLPGRKLGKNSPLNKLNKPIVMYLKLDHLEVSFRLTVISNVNFMNRYCVYYIERKPSYSLCLLLLIKPIKLLLAGSQALRLQDPVMFKSLLRQKNCQNPNPSVA